MNRYQTPSTTNTKLKTQLMSKSASEIIPIFTKTSKFNQIQSNKDQTLVKQLNLTKPGLVCIQFWAEWTPLLAKSNSLVARMCEKFPSIQFIGVDVEKNPLTAKQQGESNTVPEFLILVDGSEGDRIVGADPMLEVKLEQAKEASKSYKSYFLTDSHNLWEDVQDWDKYYAGHKIKLEKIWTRDGEFTN